MENILSVNQMKNADRYTIESLGISDGELIKRVGGAVADEIAKRFSNGNVLVCIGKGNNGEDGKVVAEKLSEFGFTVTRFFAEDGDFTVFNKDYDIVVDALFGTGLNREVTGVYKSAIEKINGLNAFIVSVDIPSGLNGDNGTVMGACVKADLTCAVEYVKTGHLLGDGLDFCGEIKVLCVGIESEKTDFSLRLEDPDVKKYFMPRKRNVNKGSFSKAAIVGGSREYSGSVLLSLNALSALKCGLGYANLTVPESLYPQYLGIAPECTMGFLKDENGRVIYDDEGLYKLLKYDAVSFGMGMGVSEEIYKSLKYLLKNFTGELIIDADGLNSLSKYGVEILLNKKCGVILTPHVKEFSRLSGLTVGDILSRPIECAKDFAVKYGVTVLLKSATSVITDGNAVYINTAGTNALAKGGSGDTLSGLIAGLITREGKRAEKVAAANYLFGTAARIATEEENEYTVSATDVIKYLPKAINSLV